MSDFFEHKFYNTYYYANIVNNILSRDVELIGFISNFFADEYAILHLAKPFQKRSAFHSFIAHMIFEFFEHDMDDHDQKIFNYHKTNSYPLEPLYAESALKQYGLFDFSFQDFSDGKQNIEYSDIEEYRDELAITGSLEELYDKISDEVFYLMFNNRDALLHFNYIVAEHMQVDLDEIEDDDVKLLFNKKGILKRTRIPEWCKRAVFFRDRGRCCFCTSDLSGLRSIKSQKNYDHIVPLAQRGLNDVSNLQLLCDNCNQKKSGLDISTSNFYEAWY